jgi:hypothetical protein
MADRFKIDLYDSHGFPFGLYALRKWSTWRPAGWVHIDHFASREEAKEYYEKIKDLPEYLT